MKYIRKKNEEQTLRVELITKETLCFIHEIENALADCQLDHVDISLLIEKATKEVTELHKQYLGYIDECNHDFIEVKTATIDRLKIRLEIIKEHLMGYISSLKANTPAVEPSEKLSGDSLRSPDFLI